MNRKHYTGYGKIELLRLRWKIGAIFIALLGRVLSIKRYFDDGRESKMPRGAEVNAQQ